jgi:hypothetical protein
MTTTRKLQKHYGNLTVVERVNLVLAAQERGDETEVHALEDCCPVAKSIEYHERMLHLIAVASVLAVQLLAREVFIVARLSDLANARQNAKQNAKQNTKQDGANPTLDGLDSNLADDDRLDLLLEQAAAAWLGFSAWCRDVGHDPHQVLRLAPVGLDDRDPAFFILHEQIELSERWPHRLLRDPDRVEEWRAAFAQVFQSIDTV